MKNRRIMVILACALCAPSVAAQTQMQDFDTVAATGDVTDIRVPAWMNGRLKIGTDGVGSVRRRALGRSEAVELFGLRFGRVERYGRFSFDVAGGGVGGRLLGDCVYDRTERNVSLGSLQLDGSRDPLLLRCVFLRDGARIGELELDAQGGGGVFEVARRTGIVRLGGAALGITSVHHLRASPIPSTTPVGYRFMRAAETIGCVDLTGFTRRRAVLPIDLLNRDAATAASLALAVFWDPGDTDD